MTDFAAVREKRVATDYNNENNKGKGTKKVRHKTKT